MKKEEVLNNDKLVDPIMEKKNENSEEKPETSKEDKTDTNMKETVEIRESRILDKKQLKINFIDYDKNTFIYELDY